MAIESQTRTIGNNTYQVSQLPAGRARKLLVKLFHVLGPAFGKLIEGLDGQKVSVADVRMESIGAAITSLSQHLTESELEYAIDIVFGSGSVVLHHPDGRRQALDKQLSDIHFSGLVSEQLRVLVFALEVNFASFFDDFGGVGGLVQQLMTPTQSHSTSQPKSTGRSGASRARKGFKPR